MVAIRHILHLPVIVALVLFSVAARANTPVVTENNINDLNADRDRFSVVEGALYITHTASDGVEPINFSSATSSFLAVSFVEGSYTARVDAATSLGNDGVVRWNVPFIFAGDYRLTGYAFFPDAERVVFDRFVTVTGVPVAAANISAVFTNQTTINLSQPSNTVSLSFVPLIASNGYLGTPDVPWGEVNAVTGRFSGSLIVEGTLDVSGAISAVDTSKVALAGDTMAGPLTNNAGFFGDGSGLTNVSAAVASLDDVGDVSVPDVTTGQVLQYDGTGWTNATMATSGLTAWQDGTGTTVQAGSYFRPINSVATNAGLFIATNGAVSDIIPDGQNGGGGAGGSDALGALSVSLGSVRSNSSQTPSGERNASIVAHRATVSASGGGNVVLGGRSGTATATISGSGGGNLLAGLGYNAGGDTITAGSGNVILGATGAGSSISGTGGGNLILGSVGLNEITGASAGSIIAAGYDNEITAGQAGIIGAGRFNRITTTTLLGAGSVIFGYRTTNTAESTFSVGAFVQNNHRGSFAYSGITGSAMPPWATTTTNQAIWRVSGGFGINTNAPVEGGLSVAGPVEIMGVRVVASGTNLFIVGVGFTNLITTTPGSL